MTDYPYMGSATSSMISPLSLCALLPLSFLPLLASRQRGGRFFAWRLGMFSRQSVDLGINSSGARRVCRRCPSLGIGY